MAGCESRTPQDIAESESSNNESQNPSIPTTELLKPMIDFGCNVLCPNWDIQQNERAALYEAYAKVIDTYFPAGIPVGPRFSAVITTVAILGPRLASRVPPKNEAGNANGGKEAA